MKLLEGDLPAYQAILAASRLKTFQVLIIAQLEVFQSQGRIQYKVVDIVI